VKELFDKLLSLGIGIAAVSKEQVEKIVDELVEKGKMTRNESSQVVEELINKGKDTQKKLEEAINRKVEEALKNLNIVTTKDLDELYKRIEVLEEKLNQSNDDA